LLLAVAALIPEVGVLVVCFKAMQVLLLGHLIL
jgi:hypothetical protein